MGMFEAWALRQTFAPDSIFSYVYDVNGFLIYAGMANRGSLKSQERWKVAKFWNNGSGQPTDMRVSAENQIFNNYATLDYLASDL